MFEYRLLGPLELRSAGSVVPLDGRRQQTLLAVLLLNAGKVVPFDRLVLDLWEQPPTTARRQIGNAAVAVRKAVGGNRLVTTGYGYRLDTTADRLDIDAFRTARQDAGTAASAGRPRDAVRLLRAALDTWRGPVLAGLDCESIDAARRDLAEQRLDATECLAELLVDLGEVTSLIGELSGLVAEHPLRESLRATLMRALRRAGRLADALAVFEEARQVIAAELGTDPGPELRGLHQQMLRSDRTSDMPPPQAGSCFLPGSTADFTGRLAELNRLTAATAGGAAGATTVVAVEGMGGVGKTALAVNLAHRLVDKFPDGQYFVDLRGFTDDEPPMSAAAALDVLLRQSGVRAEQLPPGVDACQDLWRTRVAGRRVLVVLDNAADAAQVRPLLPVSGDSLVLVTSRRQLVALDGAVPVSLDVLDTDEATLLFRRIVGQERADADPAGVRDVVGLCGGLPLAIRIAAARLRRRPAWTPGYLAEQLRDEWGRSRQLAAGDRSVAGVIAMSYRQLAPSWQRLFRLLGLIPGADFDAPAAAAVAGLTVREAATGLEELLECTLLVQDTVERYRLHDLVRDCARDLATAAHSDDDLRVARHRLFDYFLHFVDVHGGRITMSGRVLEPELRYVPEPLVASTSQEDDIRRLKADYQNIVAVAEYTGANGWYQHAWQLPCLLLPFFARAGRRPGVLDLAQGALAAARQISDERGEAHALTNLAFALQGHGSGAEVRAALDQAIRISRAISDLAAVATGLRKLGNSHYGAGDLTAAAAAYAEARNLARLVGDTSNEANTTLNLGVVHCCLGQYDEARKNLRAALARYRQSGWVEGEVLALINVGWVDQLQDRDGDAITALDRALVLSRTIGFIRGAGIALSGLSMSHRGLGRLTEAIAFGQAAVDAVAHACLAEPECDGLNALAEAYLADGRLTEARTGFQKAERIADAAALSTVRARAWEGLAHIAAEQGELDRARSWWERALAGQPSGAVDAQHARAHLAALGDRRVSCLRCRRGPAPE